MFALLRLPILIFPMFALLLTACGSPGDGDANDGATVIGALQAGLHARQPDIRVEDRAAVHGVEVEDDGFVADDLEPGDITIIVQTDDLHGEITVRNTLPGEIVEVSVREDGGSLVIRIERRVPRADHDHDHGDHHDHDDDIVFSRDHAKHRLEAGVHDGNLIITGNHIKVKGRGCSTIINGDLIIEGDHVEVKDLIVRGDIYVARGTHHVKVKEKKNCRGRHDHNHGRDDHHDRHDHDHHDRHDH